MSVGKTVIERAKKILKDMGKKLGEEEYGVRRVGYYRGICRSCLHMFGTYIYMDTLKENIIIQCGNCGYSQYRILELNKHEMNKVHKAIVLFHMKFKDDADEVDPTNWMG